MRTVASHPLPPPAPPRPSRQRAFTLMEVLIVIAIIVTLVAISMFVGGLIKRQMASRTTRATLFTLRGLMDEYLKAGNPEPVAADPIPPGAIAPVNTDSYNFVKALRTSAGSSGKLQSLTIAQDATNNKIIVDGFGNAIRFVPSNTLANPNVNNTSGRWYFLSAGPDGVLFNTAQPPPDMTTDNITSLDNL